ncbi:MAG: alpha-glucuronidase family glycosyl hydrolase [Runella zeae]
MTKLYLAVCFLFICNLSSYATKLDLSSAQIFCPIRDKEITKRSIEILQQEVKKRSNLNLSVTSTLPSQGQVCIGIALESDLSAFPEIYKAAIRRLPAISAEGFKLVVIKDKKTVLIVGKDARGILYGVGRLLRKLEMTPQQLLLPTEVSIATSPRYSIRGHQLGYRPKTNAYDAFTVGQFDQYIRELAIFGANSIEIVPPRTDDDPTSRHMVMPSLQMIAEQARICKEYGLDVWMWIVLHRTRCGNLVLLSATSEALKAVYWPMPGIAWLASTTFLYQAETLAN